jgi:hypothetical protein
MQDEPVPLEMMTLENDELRLVACPWLGGRIMSLVDRRRDREWLVLGEPPAVPAAWARETAVFGGREAFGWDECLPTVAPCPDPFAPRQPALRDHGDQWGRPATLTLEPLALVTTWSQSRWPYRFERRIELEGAVARVEYRLRNQGDRPMPFLWSMHPLLALEPGALVRIERPVDPRVTSQMGARPSEPETAEWPVPAGPTGTYLKAYARPPDPGRVVARQPDGATLSFEWDQTFAPVVGLWLDFGGWPESAPVWQVAIEPTTSGDDDLGSAIAAGRAAMLAPADTIAWSVQIALA